MIHVAGLVDAVKALRDDLLASPSVDDRNIAERLAEMVDRYEVPLTSLDANMGPATHHPGHRTERDAAVLAMPRAGTIREGIINLIASAGLKHPKHITDLVEQRGVTQEAAALILDRRLYSVAPRFAELQRMGWIKDSGRTRPTTTGTQAIVWVLTDDGLRKWAAR